MSQCVSVLVPLYNHAEYIGEALDSLLAQKDPNLEILVVDDGSSDGGDRLVEEKYVPLGIKLLRQPRNGCGTTRALNRALKHASGEYICWLSADDWFLPGKIAHQRQIYAETFGSGEGVLHASPGYVSYDLEHALQSARLPESAVRQQFLERGFVSWQESAQDPPDAMQLFYFFLFNYINGITIFLPRSLFEKYGFFSESFPLTQDYEFWFRLAWQGVPFRVMPESYSYSRMHAGNLGRYRSDIPAEVGLIVRLYSELVGSEQLKPALQAQGFEAGQEALMLARLMQVRQLPDYELLWLERVRQQGVLSKVWEQEYQRLRHQFGRVELARAPSEASLPLNFMLYLSLNTLSTWRWYMCLTHFFQAFQESDPVCLLIWVPPAENLEELHLELEERLAEITAYLGVLPDLNLDLLHGPSLSEALQLADVVIPVGSPDEAESHLLYHARSHQRRILFHASPQTFRACLAQGKDLVRDAATDYASFLASLEACAL